MDLELAGTWYVLQALAANQGKRSSEAEHELAGTFDSIKSPASASEAALKHENQNR